MATQTNKTTAPVPPGMVPASNGAWAETINLAGSESAGISGGKELNVPKGKYKCKCIGANLVTKADGEGSGQVKKNLALKLQVVEPAAYAGTIIGKVQSLKPTAVNFMNTCLQSFGVPAATFQKGPIKLNESLFKGKTCYLYCDPEKDSRGYDKREFVTPADFEAMAWPSTDAPGTDAQAPANGAETEVPAEF